ncbi:MAG: cation diffusion facilitator family transporter [Actinomycetota bacterium]
MNREQFRRAERAALISLAVTVVLVIVKSAVWLATGSLTVLSQTLDSLLDIVALALVFFGVRLAGRPADASHHYGHAKAENLAAFTQTLFIGAFVVGVVIEGLRRLLDDPGDVKAPWYAISLLALSLVVDAVRVRILLRTAKLESSEALRAGALNIAGDLLTASVGLISLGLVRAGVQRADAVGALVVAVVVGYLAVRLGRRSVDVLMDRAPIAKVEAIDAAAAGAPGVREIRRIRVRDSGDRLFADITVAAGRSATLDQAHDIAESVERAIETIAPGTDVVVHVEPISETTGLVERVKNAANRVEGVHEVHNVLVHAFDQGGEQKMHVTMHAKVGPQLSVKDAHDMSEEIEQSVIEELGPRVRVDTHIEPLRSTAFGRDVTPQREDVVRVVENAALTEADVFDCHEVLVTSTGAGLAVVAHVRGRATLPLSLMHDASERIEQRVHSAIPDLASVLIHFEPA